MIALLRCQILMWGFKMKLVSLIGAAASLAFAGVVASPALAANLVVNGSFENGTTGWTVAHTSGTAPSLIQYGNGGNYPTGAFGEAVKPNTVSSASPDAVGNTMFYFSSDTARYDVLSQTLNLVAGVTYQIGLDFYVPLNGFNNPFDADVALAIGDTMLGSSNVKAFVPQTWYNFTSSFTATKTGATALSFYFGGNAPNANNYAADFAIDRVYVNAPAVPEPATWAMMIMGMAMVGAQMRRRKAQVSFA
jgi:ABC-type amino acid transport substrate-binding protein